MKHKLPIFGLFLVFFFIASMLQAVLKNNLLTLMLGAVSVIIPVGLLLRGSWASAAYVAVIWAVAMYSMVTLIFLDDIIYDFPTLSSQLLSFEWIMEGVRIQILFISSFSMAFISWKRSRGAFSLSTKIVGDIPNVNIIVFCGVSSLVILVFTADAWVTVAPYPLNKNMGLELIPKQFSILSIFAAGAAMHLSLRASYRNLLFFSRFVFLIVMIQYFLAGDRGSVLIGWLMFAVVQVSHVRSIKRFVVPSFLFSILLLVVLNHYGAVRQNWFHMGFFEAIVFQSERTIERHWLAEINLFPQALAHLLHVLDLASQGIWLEGAALLGLPASIIPSFIYGFFGLEPPYASAWWLADYRRHGGGFYSVAESYANFLSPGVYFFAFALGLLYRFVEYLKDFTKLSRLAYSVVAASAVLAVFYGLQAGLRIIEVYVLVVFVTWYLEKSKGRLSQGRMARRV